MRRSLILALTILLIPVAATAAPDDRLVIDDAHDESVDDPVMRSWMSPDPEETLMTDVCQHPAADIRSLAAARTDDELLITLDLGDLFGDFRCMDREATHTSSIYEVELSLVDGDGAAFGRLAVAAYWSIDEGWAGYSSVGIATEPSPGYTHAHDTIPTENVFSQGDASIAWTVPMTGSDDVRSFDLDGLTVNEVDVLSETRGLDEMVRVTDQARARNVGATL